MNEKLDIIFLITGKPLPAMLDMALHATNFGRNVAMIVLDRNVDDLKIDQSLVNYEIITINVPYKSLDFSRFISLPKVFQNVSTIVNTRLKVGGIIMTGSYDLLFLANLVNWKRKYRIRHQVRDLHILQLSNTMISRFFVFIEKILLSNVESVIVSSPAFADNYYKNIFKGSIVLLENTPASATWQGFKKRSLSKEFVVGFIGIIRYKESLNQLIDAVQNLIEKGIPIKVFFAGGGDIDDLKQRIRFKENFEFFGAYEYSKDIISLYSKIDLIYAVYDSNDPNCRLAMPNKFYESIISKIPILVADRTFVGREVVKAGIGSSVLSGNVETLEQLLLEAAHNSGWYLKASDVLDKVDPEFYFSQYNNAMKISIL